MRNVCSREELLVLWCAPSLSFLIGCSPQFGRDFATRVNPNRGASLKIHRLSFSLPFRTNERMNVVYLSQPPFLSAPRHFRRRRRTFPSYLSTTVATRRTTPACSLLPSDGRQTRTRFHFRRSESGGSVLSLSLSLVPLLRDGLLLHHLTQTMTLLFRVANIAMVRYI